MYDYKPPPFDFDDPLKYKNICIKCGDTGTPSWDQTNGGNYNERGWPKQCQAGLSREHLHYKCACNYRWIIYL